MGQIGRCERERERERERGSKGGGMTSRLGDNESRRREGWLWFTDKTSEGEFPERTPSECRSTARQSTSRAGKKQMCYTVSHGEDRSMEGYDDGGMRRVLPSERTLVGKKLGDGKLSGQTWVNKHVEISWRG